MIFPERPEETSTVIANTSNGAMWAGVWGDPDSLENHNKLKDIRMHTGEDYQIMTFMQAENIRLAIKQQQLKENS